MKRGREYSLPRYFFIHIIFISDLVMHFHFSNFCRWDFSRISHGGMNNFIR